MAGGFLGPTEKEACANQEFLYEECPDVDECRLGMHNCHEKGNFGWCPQPGKVLRDSLHLLMHIMLLKSSDEHN